MRKKPVYLLVKGDVFFGEDGRAYTVDEVIVPDDWRLLTEVGAKPKNWEIHAHAGTLYRLARKFYYPGTKIVRVIVRVKDSP